MEQIVGFPLSIVVILAFSLMWCHLHPESSMARGIAYLAGVMLIVSVGFVLNVPVVAYTGSAALMYLVFAITFLSAFLLFLKGIDVLSTKRFFIFLGAALAVSGVVAAIILINIF